MDTSSVCFADSFPSKGKPFGVRSARKTGLWVRMARKTGLWPVFTDERAGRPWIVFTDKRAGRPWLLRWAPA